MTAETLSGTPSIVYGLFGMLFFVDDAVAGGYSILVGCDDAGDHDSAAHHADGRGGASNPSPMTLSRRQPSASAPEELRTVFRIALPSAVPGIMAGDYPRHRAHRRRDGCAALSQSGCSSAQIPSSPRWLGCFGADPCAAHVRIYRSEGLYVDQAYATAVVLLVVVLVINALSDVRGQRN